MQFCIPSGVGLKTELDGENGITEEVCVSDHYGLLSTARVGE